MLSLMMTLALAGAQPADLPVSLTRLDCGTIKFANQGAFFSDTFELEQGEGTRVDSCYLIRHGPHLMLWDTGLPAAMKGNEQAFNGLTPSVSQTLLEQLDLLDIDPKEIDVVGISHRHFDHIGQVGDFTHARLVIGKGDFTDPQTAPDPDPFVPWRGEDVSNDRLSLVTGADVDIFGDGKVVAIRLPGHTPDHLGLLVRLASGNVLLTGDLYHLQEARDKGTMPGFNTSRADTLASMDRFEAMAKALDATVIIQHEPADVDKLPAFPEAAE